MKTVGIYGANGIVGQLVLKELERTKSKVQIKTFGRNDVPAQTDIAILCTDDEVSAVLAKELKNKCKFIIDMSAKFRKDEGVPLVIPEINPHAITKDTQLIASPNCTTTGLVMALHPLRKKYHLTETFFCSYQAISGGGKKLIEEFEAPANKYKANCVPQIGSVQENGYTSEEMKAVFETRKILELSDIKVRPHTVRVPVLIGHSLGVTLKADRDFDLAEVETLWKQQPGVIYDGNIYTPKEAEGSVPVYISRLRQDCEDKNIIHFWITFDNLLKGAALNGRQIAEYILEKFF